MRKIKEDKEVRRRIALRMERLLGIPMSRNKRNALKTELIISGIRELFENGITDVAEIAKTTGRSHQMVYYYIRKGNIPLPPRPKRRKKLVDKLIREGHALRLMADQEGVSEQAIQQYIKQTGQHELWKERKDAIKIKDEVGLRQARRNLLSILNCAVDEATKQNWPTQKAVEYTRSFKHIRMKAIRDETLLTIFKRYEEAQKSEKWVSLAELGRDTGLYASSVARILKRTGLKPFFKAGKYYPRKPTSQPSQPKP